MRRLGADAVFLDTREVLVVAPTSDGQAVDIEYDVSNRRLDAWSRRAGLHQVHSGLLLLLPAFAISVAPILAPRMQGQSCSIVVAARQTPTGCAAKEGRPQQRSLPSAEATGPVQIVVATGFIAKTPGGQVTTLKRNGSDYSATIMGALVRSSRITIWTDVDGVFSADPRKVRCWAGTAAGVLHGLCCP